MIILEIADARKDLKRVILQVHRYGYVHLRKRGVPVATIIPYKEGMDSLLPGFTNEQIQKMLRELQPDTEVGKCQICGARDCSIASMKFYLDGKIVQDNICSKCYSTHKEYKVPIDPKNETEVEIIPQTKTTQYVCNNCGKVCANMLGLRAHMRIHNKQTLDTLDAKDGETESVPDMQASEDREGRDRINDEGRDTIRSDNQTIPEQTEGSEDSV